MHRRNFAAYVSSGKIVTNELRSVARTRLVRKIRVSVLDTSLGINLPAYSETVVRVKTTEQGNKLLEAVELQENSFLRFECGRMQRFSISLFNSKFKFYGCNSKEVSASSSFT